jgi:hypothetical protein
MPCSGTRRGWKAGRTVFSRGRDVGGSVVSAVLASRLKDATVVIVATTGLWFFWSQYSYLSGLSWWYDNVHQLHARVVVPQPDYDLTTLPWQMIHPRTFEIAKGRLRIITNDEAFGYQVLANVKTNGANAADIQFDIDVESGGVTVGLLQAGKWIASNSATQAGQFSDWNSAQLGYHRTLTIAIANDNAAGESRLTVKALRVFLRQ